MSLNELAQKLHATARSKGFYDKQEDLLGYLKNVAMKPDLYYYAKKLITSQRLALMHSELSEGLEADRKDLMDDKLPQYKGVHVEAVDALIRILDFLADEKVDIDAIVEAKNNFNQKREVMHGGKAY